MITWKWSDAFAAWYWSDDGGLSWYCLNNRNPPPGP